MYERYSLLLVQMNEKHKLEIGLIIIHQVIRTDD